MSPHLSVMWDQIVDTRHMCLSRYVVPLVDLDLKLLLDRWSACAFFYGDIIRRSCFVPFEV